MNLTLVEMILSALYIVIGAYIGWVHHRQSKAEDRLRDVENKVSSFGNINQSLQTMDAKLDRVARMVYMIAGKEGIKPHDDS